MKYHNKKNKSFDRRLKELLRDEYKAVEVSEIFIDDTRLRISTAINSDSNNDKNTKRPVPDRMTGLEQGILFFICYYCC